MPARRGRRPHALITYLKRRFGYRSYLELGCRGDANLKRVPFADRVGVDPVEGGTVCATSDMYFASCARTFDLVFVDGLHSADQVVRDVRNALAVLNPGGCVVLHDCKPLFEAEAMFPMPPGVACWNGTVWQAVAHLRTLADVDVAVGDFDWASASCVRPNRAPLALAKPYRLTWADYCLNVDACLRPSTMREIWLGER